MLSLVWFANRTTHWFPAEETAIRASRTKEQN
jgi:ACR3 family arsenite transporter